LRACLGALRTSLAALPVGFILCARRRVRRRGCESCSSSGVDIAYITKRGQPDGLSFFVLHIIDSICLFIVDLDSGLTYAYTSTKGAFAVGIFQRKPVKKRKLQSH
jgi:hypothetical protein